MLQCRWRVEEGSLQPVVLFNRLTGESIDLTGSELFRLTLADGTVLAAADCRLLGPLSLETIKPKLGASCMAERFAGRALVAHLDSGRAGLWIDWRAILRDGANTVRQEITLTAKEKPVSIREVQLVDLPLEGAEVPGGRVIASRPGGWEAATRVVGSVPGSPLAAGDLFFAYEHPDSTSAIKERAASSLVFNLTLLPGQSVGQSAVAGVAPAAQLRRSFLYYVERERAHPYRPFLHYNAWYDICWSELKIREEQCLEVIDRFGRELIQQRRVPLASFVWDDGWDDPQTLWRPLTNGFPNGFGAVLSAAQRQQSTLGFWLSPFGGYGKPAQDRLLMGKAEGFETGPQGFSLAGPNYYARFQETCGGFIRGSGANFFKFDGLARSVEETEAMLRLTRALRALRPDLFISITTGTWPSPFWLWYGDSTWRGGGDMGFHGPGSKREQWITYRDLETYRGVVQRAPLYPLNSLMTQGFAHARYGSASECGNDADEIRRELRSFFASGTCLQELYVTPSMMSARNWDDLAEAATWARRRADVLVDTHWVGGDPGKGEVYGWASWTRRGGVLALRNPSAQPAGITLDVGTVFELPAGAARRHVLKSPWKDDAAKARIRLTAGTPHRFELAPFEVLVLETIR